jgi:two-component system C4-dicarboxylate transport response regulator DctD
MMPDVIIVDDEQHLRMATTQTLELDGFRVESFARGEEALERIGRSFPGVVVSDVKMAGIDGLALMARVLEVDPDVPVILVTGHGDIPMAVQAIRNGAYDFIQKPFSNEMLVDAVRRGLEKRRLVLENRRLREELAAGGRLEQVVVGRSPQIARLREMIAAYAPTEADVLIVGETGAGKELVARSLHDMSPRAGERFVAINCGALPDTIIESELFGHEAGAFTGATKSRIGRLEYASGGTLFLDEIESMPLELQIRLLRVLQERTIVRLGANAEVAIDVRVIAATKEDLAQASEQGRFRKDLYYRLNVLSLAIPPLRRRREDIALLFGCFLARAGERLKRNPPPIDAKDMALLMAHDWPGNVRELQNVAMRAALGFGVELRPDATDTASGETRDAPAKPLPDQLAELERIIIQQTLVRCNGSLKATYETLGIGRKTLYEKMRRHGLGDPLESE